MNQHQISHTTGYNRYPNIFGVCSTYFAQRQVKILSFGCADGSEVFTLRDLYFPTSEIHGIDISKAMIDSCNAKNLDTRIKFKLTEEMNQKKETYGLIFCMSVLCRWPQTQHINDCENIYPFKEFCQQLFMLDAYLEPGGLLVIFNSNFCFFETDLYSSYTPLTEENIKESGFVHKFNSKNKKVDINYKDCIFIKKQAKTTSYI